MRYHCENKSGWMSEVSGLTYFKGKYHVFFQHYPYAPRWGQMHWGHAISSDLITWEEIDIALTPEENYENQDGCLAGSAIVKDNRLYLFYTSSSSELGQTQSVAYSDDGIHFTKYENNPVIKESPLGDSRNFRNPKVFRFNNEYRMVIGAGHYNIASVLLYKSIDLINWEYVGELLTDARYGSCIESPDLFQVEDKYVLMFSSIKSLPHRVCFITGEFDGEVFEMDEPDNPVKTIEVGPDFYAAQSMETPDGRRILMAWMFNWSRRQGEGQLHVGALTIPRQLEFDLNDNLTLMPCDEAMRYVIKESRFVSYENGRLRIVYEGKLIYDRAYKEEPEILVLEDVGVVEVFVNGGIDNITTYIC